MLTAENRLARLTGIGASEIAAVCGISNPGNDTQLTVYQSKVDPPSDDDDAQTTDTERGNFLEGGILEWAAHRLGTKILRNNELVRHPSIPWCIATPDGYELIETVRNATAEAKSPRRGDHWTDPREDRSGMPEHVFVQVQWQMLATGLKHGVVVALVYGEPWIYRVEASDGLQSALLEAGEAFWKLVESRTPPDPSEPGDAEVFGRMVRQTSKRLVVPADVDEARRIAEAFDAHRRIAKENKEAADRLKCLLLPMIGDAYGLDLGKGAPRVTYSQARDGESVDWKSIALALAGKVDGETYKKLLGENTRIKRGVRSFRVTMPRGTNSPETEEE